MKLNKLFLTATFVLLSVPPSFGAKQSTYATKTTPVGADKVLITDSEDSNKTKQANISAMRAALGLGTSDNPSFNSIHASGGNLAAANAQVTKKWITGLSYTADVTSVIHGGKHWIAKTTHTAGSTTEPGVGASYTDAWTEVSGAGDDLGDASYSDVVALWTTCTGYLKSDGTCDTPSGSATYPGSAGVAYWNGSAWGTSYTVGTAASNLIQLNASAQLPAVSAALLTNFPTLNQNTTGTAAGLSGTPNITVGTISAGAGGFSVASDGALTVKSVTTARTTSPSAVDFYEANTEPGDNKLTLTLQNALASDRTIYLDTMFTSTQLTTPIIVDGSTLTFDESAADPNDADIQLSATDGVFKIAAVNGANNEDLTVDLDASANKAKFNSGSGLTLITTGSIPFTGAIRTVGKDSDYTIGTDDADEAYGAIFFNTGASTRTFTLPSAVAGMSVCIKNLQGVSQVLRLDAETGDYIVKSTGARTSASGEYYGATADAKNQLCVVAYDSTDWYVTSEAGTWTEEE